MSIGMWIWNLPPLNGVANRKAYWSEIAGLGLSHVVLKILDGERNYNGDSLRQAVEDAKGEGLHVWVWGYEYPAPEDFTALGQRATALGADGVVIDAETEWDGKPGLDYGGAIRDTYHGLVYLSSYYSKEAHPEFPWDDFSWVDGYMPQVYGSEPSVAALLEESRASFGGSPWIPTGLADSQIGSLSQTQEFVAACLANRWICNLWVWEHCTTAMKAAIQTASAQLRQIVPS